MHDRPFDLDPPTAADTAAARHNAQPRYIVDTLAGCTPDATPPAPIAAVIASDYTLETQLPGALVYRSRDGVAAVR